MTVAIRGDFDARGLRATARRSKDAAQARRLLALAAVYDGGRRTEAAEIGGVTLQIVRDWVLRFNAEGPDGLVDRKAPGQPSRLNDTHRAALTRVIEAGPIPAIHGVVRWRIVDLCQWMWEEFRVVIARQTLSRELRALGYRKLSARPRHHAQAAGAVEDFKKKSPACWARSRAKRGSSRQR
jgi:transposase